MMFWEMKRKKQLLSKEETEAILSRGKTGFSVSAATTIIRTPYP